MSYGIEFDAAGLLRVTLEFEGRVVALRKRGETADDYEVVKDHGHDVRLDCRGCPDKINMHPHGLGAAVAGRLTGLSEKREVRRKIISQPCSKGAARAPPPSSIYPAGYFEAVLFGAAPLAFRAASMAAFKLS
jgi:hypothetical protein